MSRLTPPLGPQDHVAGSGTSITIVEYGDYECPYCGQAQTVVQEVLSELGDEARYAFRHFPLTQAHPHALQAAEAAEVAASLGDFWGMHTLLFDNQDRLSYPFLRLYAQQLQLDVTAFDERMRRQAGLRRVREDLRSGLHSGVNGTPTFFLNGERHEGAADAASLLAAIARVS